MLNEVYLDVCDRGITKVSILKTIGTVWNKKCTLLPFSIMNVIILLLQLLKRIMQTSLKILWSSIENK